MKNMPLKMVLSSLDSFPEYDLPEDYSFRGYLPGDRDIWVALTAVADKLQLVTGDVFDREFGGRDAELSKRMFFLCHGDDVIGTSTAWCDSGGGPALGRVHWLAIHPDYQGKGLSKPLLSETLRRLRGFGSTSAYLISSTGRTAAIILYEKFGFFRDRIV